MVFAVTRQTPSKWIQLKTSAFSSRDVYANRKLLYLQPAGCSEVPCFTSTDVMEGNQIFLLSDSQSWNHPGSRKGVLSLELREPVTVCSSTTGPQGNAYMERAALPVSHRGSRSRGARAHCVNLLVLRKPDFYRDFLLEYVYWGYFWFVLSKFFWLFLISFHPWLSFLF